jgi:hypothetical protein
MDNEQQDNRTGECGDKRPDDAVDIDAEQPKNEAT